MNEKKMAISYLFALFDCTFSKLPKQKCQLSGQVHIHIYQMWYNVYKFHLSRLFKKYVQIINKFLHTIISVNTFQF